MTHWSIDRNRENEERYFKHSQLKESYFMTVVMLDVHIEYIIVIINTNPVSILFSWFHCGHG